MFHSVVHDPPEPARALMSAMLRAALAQAEPPPWLLKYPLQLSSPMARQVLWALGRRLSQNPDVGFVMANDVPEHALGSLWQLYEVVPTLRTLTAHYDEWASLLLDFARGTVRNDGELCWFDTRASSGIRLDRAEQDFRVCMTLKYWRRLTRTADLTPVQVHFAYPRPTSLAWHTRLLGNAGLRFSQPYLQIALPRALADARLPGANDALYETRRAQARAAAGALVTLPIPQRVEALITERLVHATHEVEVAKLLGLSVRSLRRKLAVGGVSFRALLARARERERELFAQAALSSAETARLLGFANRGALRNSLQRAARPELAGKQHAAARQT